MQIGPPCTGDASTGASTAFRRPRCGSVGVRARWSLRAHGRNFLFAPQRIDPLALVVSDPFEHKEIGGVFRPRKQAYSSRGNVRGRVPPSVREVRAMAVCPDLLRPGTGEPGSVALWGLDEASSINLTTK